MDGDAVLVDATDFFLSDAHQAAERLTEGKQGRYRVDLSRSAIYLPRTRNFPENTDVESTLTLAGDEPSEFVRTVTPDPRAVTLHEHFSFIQAPRLGSTAGRSIHAPAILVSATWISLRPPTCPLCSGTSRVIGWPGKMSPRRCEPVKPIVYYVDRAIPEPIRSAVLEGAGWWNQAFTVAGYKDAFQVGCCRKTPIPWTSATT